MDNHPGPIEETNLENLPLAESTVIPPKPPGEEPKSRANVWLRSISSLLLYLAIGYYFFNQNWTLVMVLTAVVIFHELGHFLAMKIYNYTDLGIFFIPLVGAYASGKKREVSQLQSSIILLAGPVPGIVAGIAIFFIVDPGEYDFTYNVCRILIYLNLLNLLPIYPLDGGQLLNRLFLDNSQIISKIFLFVSIAAMIWFGLVYAPKPFGYALLLIPVFLLSRIVTDSQFDKLTKKVEDEGFDMNTTYEEISDEDYWKIRNILVRNHPALKDVAQAPPYEYSHKEEQVKTLINNLLQRTIHQDLSIMGKIIIILVWAGCFVAPFLIRVSQ
jgi:stage IV sporulation protein FB